MVGGETKIETELSVNEHSRDGDFRGGGKDEGLEEDWGGARKGGGILEHGRVLGMGDLRKERDFCSKVPNWWPTGQILLCFACSKIKSVREFPGDPAVRIRRFHC